MMDDQTLETLLKQDNISLAKDRLQRLERSILTQISTQQKRGAFSSFLIRPTASEGLLAGLMAGGVAAALVGVAGAWQSVLYHSNAATWSAAVYHVWG